MTTEQRAYIASAGSETAGARMSILKSQLSLEGRISSALESLAQAQHHLEMWLKETQQPTSGCCE